MRVDERSERVVVSGVAYGVRLGGPLLGPRYREVLSSDDAAPAGWPVVTVRFDVRRARARPTTVLTRQRADVLTMADCRLRFDRATMSAEFEGSVQPPPLVVAHSGLSALGIIAGWWLDRPALHAGVVVGPAGACGILGAKGAGKSTLLSASEAAGLTVLADDLLVVEHGMALAGPRLLSLRCDAAEKLSRTGVTVQVGAERRTRVRLGPAPLSSPLLGLVVLDAGDGNDAGAGGSSNISMEPVPFTDRLALLGEHQASRMTPPSPRALLELAAIPMWILKRPKQWSMLDPSIDAVAGLVGEPAAGIRAARSAGYR